MAGKAGKSQRGFGRLRQFRSGRWKASYTGPDGDLHHAPSTFAAKIDAEAWLTDERRKIDRELWSPPAEPVKAATVRLTFGEYATDWLAHREIKERTRAHYTRILEEHLTPQWGSTPIRSITPDDVRAWYRTLDRSTPTMRSHIYGLMRTIMATAAGDGVIETNPVHVRGAGTVKRASKTEPASLAELEAIVGAIDVIPATKDAHRAERNTDRGYGAMVLVAAWCALRYGELTELRRRDIVGDRIRVRRAVVRVDGEFRVGSPKSDAGVRDVTIPPHLIPVLDQHLAEYVDPSPDALLWSAESGGHMAPATFYRHYYRAREAAGRPDLRFHDLRHTGAVLAAQTGATLAELMDRLGHSTPAAAMRYQHAARDRDRQIAAAMSALANPPSQN